MNTLDTNNLSQNTLAQPNALEASPDVQDPVDAEIQAARAQLHRRAEGCMRR